MIQDCTLTMLMKTSGSLRSLCLSFPNDFSINSTLCEWKKNWNNFPDVNQRKHSMKQKVYLIPKPIPRKTKMAFRIYTSNWFTERLTLANLIRSLSTRPRIFLLFNAKAKHYVTGKWHKITISVCIFVLFYQNNSDLFQYCTVYSTLHVQVTSSSRALVSVQFHVTVSMARVLIYRTTWTSHPVVHHHTI